MIRYDLHKTRAYKAAVVLFLIATLLLCMIAYFKVSVILFIAYILMEAEGILVLLGKAQRQASERFQQEIGIDLNETMELDKVMALVQERDPQRKRDWAKHVSGICYLCRGEWQKAQACYEQLLTNPVNEWDALMIQNHLCICALDGRSEQFALYQQQLEDRLQNIKVTAWNKAAWMKIDEGRKRNAIIHQLEQADTEVIQQLIQEEKRLLWEESENCRQRLMRHYTLACCYLRLQDEERLQQELRYLRPYRKQTFFYQDVLNRKEAYPCV